MCYVENKTQEHTDIEIHPLNSVPLTLSLVTAPLHIQQGEYKDSVNMSANSQKQMDTVFCVLFNVCSYLTQPIEPSEHVIIRIYTSRREQLFYCMSS